MGKTQNKIKVLIEIEVNSNDEGLVSHALEILKSEVDDKISESKYMVLIPGVHFRQVSNLYSYSLHIVKP